MSDTTELIKDKLEIVEFLRPYVALAAAGKNFKGLCPFHKEKTPSFIVSPDRQVWHCFGCNLGGDIISFLMRYENIEFLEALKILGERAGIDVKTAGLGDQRQYLVLYEINNAAKEFFRNYLKSDAAVAGGARQYLTERGLKPETVEEFELGLAPNVSDALSRELLKLGFKISDIERAGLILKTERGTYWDRFRHRIMFPLYNNFGKTIAFTGRLMPGSEETAQGKYVNSPETPIFSKSRLLFGFHQSKNVIRETKTAVLVEGQMDLIMASQDGVKNAAATSGTALTQDHLKNLRRLADTIVIAFDSDAAGELASERAIDLAQSFDFNVKVIKKDLAERDDLKDPADIVRQAPGLLIQMIKEAEPAMRYYLRRYLPIKQSAPDGIEISELKRRLRTVLSKVRTITSQIEQAYWIKELSALTKIAEEHIFDEMRSLPVSAGRDSAVPSSPPEETQSALDRNFSRRELIAQRIISLGVNDSECRSKMEKLVQFFSGPYQLLAEAVIGKSAENLTSELKNLFDLIVLRSSFNPSEIISPTAEFEELTRQLQKEDLRERREALQEKISRAERENNEAELKNALQEFDYLSREMHNI